MAGEDDPGAALDDGTSDLGFDTGRLIVAGPLPQVH